MKEEIDQALLMVKCGQMKLKKSNKDRLFNNKSIVTLGMDMDMDVVDIISRFHKILYFNLNFHIFGINFL